MADERKVIYIEVNSQKAIDGSAAATRALQAIETQTAKTAAAMEKIESGFDFAAMATKALVAIKVVKEIADKVMSLFSTVRDAASAISDFSEILGVSTTYVQAAMFSAAQHTISIEKLTQGYTKASQVIGQASLGQKDAVELFDRLGVKVLDSAGKLRSTEIILSESAAALLKIEDPAKRVTTAMELFGKSGAQLIPMLADLAGGSAAMAAKAAAAGAIIEDKVIEQLSKLKSHAEASALKWNALVANIGAPIATQAMEAVNAILGDILKNIDRLKQDKKETSYGIPAAKGDVANLQEQLDAQQGLLAINPNNFAAKASVAALQKRIGAAKDAENVARDQLATELLVSGTFKPTEPPDPEGKKSPTVKASGGGGESPEDKYRKLTSQLNIAAAAQDAMTAAAARGDQAFEKQKAHVDAQSKTLEIFGKVLDDNDPRLQKLEQMLLRISQGKAAEAFAVGTTELQKQNELLDAQLGLMNASPEIQAREIALIKAKTEAQKAGLDLDSDAYKARLAAVEVNERLKIQQEELKKAQELWTEPLKQALRDIQSTAADAFEQMLESGKISFESLGQVFKKIIVRMIAEYMALSTIRPVMSIVVNTISGSSTANQLGVGGGGGLFGSGGLTGMLGGGGLGGGGLGGLGGSGGGGLGSLFGGLFGGGGVTAASAPLGGYTATLGANGLGTTSSLGASATGSSFSGLGGGVSAGGMLSGGLSIGMGAMSLLNGGTKTTGGTIGGIGQMVGGGLMMIPTPWTMAAGAIISMASSILPGLLGGDTPPAIVNQEYGHLAYGANGFGTSGGAWGPDAKAGNLQGPLAQAGNSIDSLFKALGGVKDASKVWGVSMESYSKKDGKGWDFSNQTSYLVGPDGQKRQWGQGSTTADIGMDTAAAKAALESILGGATGDLSANMRKVLAKADSQEGGASLDALKQIVGDITAFDDAIKGLGKSTTDAESALKAVDDGFKALYDTADKYSLGTGEIDAAKARQRFGVGLDFANDLARQLMSPGDAAMLDADAERKKAYENNEYFRKNLTGYVDQAVQIETIYQRKRLAIMEEGNAAALAAAAAQKAAANDLATAALSSVDKLQDLIRTLSPGGALANLDPRSQLAGLQATYRATYAQAASGDSAAIDRFSADASAYAEQARSFYAGSAEYNRIRDEVLQQAQQLQVTTVQGVQATPALDADAKNLLAQILAELRKPATDPARDANAVRLENLLLRFFADAAKKAA